MKTGFCLRAGSGGGKKCLGCRSGPAARGRVSKHLQRPRIRACADEFGGTFASEELDLSHPGSDHLFNRPDIIGFQVLRSFYRRARVRGSIAAEVSSAILNQDRAAGSRFILKGCGELVNVF